jgi:hypothetical protein
VIELPLLGRSDIAREVRIVRHDLDNAASEVLHSAGGLAVTACRRDTGLTVAYQPQDAPDSTTIVDILIDATGAAKTATLLVDDLKPSQVLCRKLGDRAAVVGIRPLTSAWRTVVLSPGATEILMDGPGGLPAALSIGGGTLLSTGSSGAMSLISSQGPVVVKGPSQPESLVVSGDRTLTSTAAGTWTIALDGTDTRMISADPLEINSLWASGDGGFLGVEKSLDSASYSGRLKRLFYLAASGQTTDIPSDNAGEDPFVFHASPSQGYLMVSSGRTSTLLSVDIAAAAITSQEPFPLCDDATMRAKRGCLP